MKSRWLAYVLFGSVSFGLACKGGDGVSLLEVVETVPVEGQDNVIVDTPVRVRFSAVINPSTLGANTLFLTDERGDVVPSMVSILDEPNADASQMGTAAELIPDESLSVSTTFTVTVTDELESSGGLSLKEDVQWTFRTLPSAWGEAQWIEPLGTWTSRQQGIAVDEQLSAIAVWELDDRAEPTNSTFIYANRYTRTGVWGEPEPIDDGNGRASRPMIALDGPGNGFAVWERGNFINSDREIWTNRYDVDGGQWGTAELLQNGDVTRAKLPSVAADPSGNATAIWVQDDLETGRQAIRAIRYDPGTGWGASETIATPLTTVAAAITDVGMDDQGGAIAIWDPPGGVAGQGVRLLWASEYTPGSGWGEAVLVKSDDSTSANGFRLDVGANGDAFAIWRQGNGSETEPRNDVWAARFSEGNWSAPARIDTHDAGDKKEPDIAVDGAGVAYAVWSQADEDFDNIYVVEYTPTPGPGWGDPVLVEPSNEEPDDDGNAETPRVDVNRDGNVFIVWRQVWDQAGSIWSNHRDPEETWDPNTAGVIEEFPESARLPEIVVDEAPHAHSVWLHNETNGPKVRTNRFE